MGQALQVPCSLRRQAGTPQPGLPSHGTWTAEVSTQTFSSTRDAATRTTRTATTSRGCGTRTPDTRTSETQTTELPDFSGMESIVEELETAAECTGEDQRWDRRTRQGARNAAVPPPIPDRVGRPAPAEDDQEVLLPRRKTSKEDDDHSFIFHYEDGSRPTHQIT